jgi:hypothetical protein
MSIVTVESAGLSGLSEIRISDSLHQIDEYLALFFYHLFSMFIVIYESVGMSIVTVESAGLSGLSQITKRQASGTTYSVYQQGWVA